MPAVGRRPVGKSEPDPPDLAVELLESPPGPLSGGSRWVAVRADADVGVDAGAVGAEVRESVLTGVDLSGRDLSRLLARDTVFERCDLSGARLDGAALERVSFVGCRLTGAMLTDASLRDVRLTDCQGDLLNLRMSSAQYLLVTGTSLREADFYDMSMRRCALLGCELTGASFRGCRLEDVDLHGSRVAGLADVGGIAGASVAPDQVIALAAALLQAAGVSVSEAPRFGSSN